jgi:hypothetical protein
MMRVFSPHRFPIRTIAVFIRVFANILATALTVAFRRPPWSQPYDGSHQVAPTNQEVLLIRGGNGTERMAPRRESSAARSRFFPFSPLRLALAAPREEGGREICRVAVTYRRAGLFFRRVRVGLHQLPIKMPGGMTEHWKNDSETDEER